VAWETRLQIAIEIVVVACGKWGVGNLTLETDTSLVIFEVQLREGRSQCGNSVL
jgi:hypothetical protein